MSAGKLDTKMRACRMGCGVRVWCERPTYCPACRAQLRWVAEQDVHGNGHSPPELIAVRAALVERYRRRAEKGLPLFGAA